MSTKDNTSNMSIPIPIERVMELFIKHIDWIRLEDFHRLLELFGASRREVANCIKRCWRLGLIERRIHNLIHLESKHESYTKGTDCRVAQGMQFIALLHSIEATEYTAPCEVLGLGMIATRLAGFSDKRLSREEINASNRLSKRFVDLYEANQSFSKWQRSPRLSVFNGSAFAAIIVDPKTQLETQIIAPIVGTNPRRAALHLGLMGLRCNYELC